MKQKIIKSKLLRVFILISLFTCFFSCEKEEISNNNLVTNQNQNNYQLKKVRFSQLKKNKKAFDKLVEARIKKNPSLEYRGVYNSDFGVFIDTTNITLIESKDSHSYTFQIINENMHEFENLILNYKNNGDYSAYISKYNLTQEQINNLIDSGSLTNIVPTSISEVNSTMSIPVSGNGSDCVDIITYSTNMCYNSQGNLMESNGELNNGCVGMSFPVEHMIMVIDADCMSGGGPGGYDGSGGDNGGYNPGSGGTGGFGGNTGGTGGNTGGNNTGENTGNPPNNGGNSGNPINNNPNINDGNNPIVTSPVININKTEVKLLNSLTPQQNDWWNDPSTSQETKDDIINFLNQNSDNQSQAEEAIDFVKEFIDNDNNSGLDLDFEKSKKSPANIDVTEIDTTTTEGKKFDCIYKKLMESNSFKNLFVNTFGGTQTKFNVKFEIADSFPNPTTEGNCQMITTNNGTTFTNIIKIKRSILQENNNGIGNSSNIKIAKIIIHELIHAYLNIKKVNCNQGATLPFINNLELGELIQSFYQNFNCEIDFNGSPQSQHSFMFDFLIPTFQSIFQETRDSLISDAHIQYANSVHFSDASLGIDEQWNWDDFYKYITLNGLHQCESFNLEITNNPTENFLYNFYKNYENSVTKTCL